MVNVTPVDMGKTTRMSFARINEVLNMPNLIEVQKNSYEWFIKDGLKEVFRDVSFISDHSGNLFLEFVEYQFDDKPKYDIMECKKRDATYAVPLRCRARLKNMETGETLQSDFLSFADTFENEYLAYIEKKEFANYTDFGVEEDG